jgi:hypothetical protein
MLPWSQNERSIDKIFGCLVPYQVIGGMLDIARGPVLPSVHRRATAVAAGDPGGRLLGEWLPLLLSAAPLYYSPFYLRHKLRRLCQRGGRRRGIIDRGRGQRRRRRDRARWERGTGGHGDNREIGGSDTEVNSEEAVSNSFFAEVSHGNSDLGSFGPGPCTAFF